MERQSITLAERDMYRPMESSERFGILKLFSI